MNKIVALLDRAVLKIMGPDSEDFLQNLITNDMKKAKEFDAVFAALLTPQGKINYEFFIVPVAGGYLLDTARGGAADLLKKLGLYKMRSNITIEDLSETHLVVSCGEAEVDDGLAEVVFVDPRSSLMGRRAVVSVAKMGAFCENLETGSEEDYLKRRLLHQIPEGGYDYALGDTFPHEAAYDLLDGVDFQKGCYVGQEVISRMAHRGTTRKRIVVVRGDQPLPDAGAVIKTEGSMIGVLGSQHERDGLALVRLDRAAKAIATDAEMKAEGVRVALSIPQWASYDFPTLEEG